MTSPHILGALQLVGVLGAEVMLVALAVALLARRARSATWQRALWQAGLMALLVLTACELSGTARALADRTVFALAGSDRSGRSTPEATGARLTDEFRSKVKARLAAREGGINFPGERTGGSSGLTAPEQAAKGSHAAGSAAARAASELGSDSIYILYLWLLWMTGTLLVATRAWVGRCLLFLFRLRRRPVSDPAVLGQVRRLATALGIHRRVRVVESAGLSGPIAFGLLHPSIGLPADFSGVAPARREAMLAHELAHLASKDPMWSLVADFCAALLWWHPAVWWVRRQLYLASELAADEASLMLKDGPAVLAECLLELGARLVGDRALGQLPMSGFRSHLGRRVQRLLHLETTAGSPPDRWRAALLLTFGPLALAALVVLCTAWATPQVLTKGNTMRSTRLTWKRSLATFALLAAIHDSGPADAAVDAANSPAQPAAPALATPSVNGPAAHTSPALPGVQPSNNTPPASDADRARKAFLRRYGLAPSAVQFGNAGNVPAPNPKREKIEARLDEIILPEIAFDGLPLGEVIRVLSDQSVKLDPQQKGINFLLSQSPATPSAAPETFIDPATGLPAAVPPEPIDMGSVMIKFTLPLRNVSLKDTLQAVVRVADHPIEYTVEDYGVVFSPKPEANVVSTGAATEALVACTFRVDTNTFLAGLENAFGISVPSAVQKQPGAHAREIQTALDTLLTQLGVSLVNAKTIFYNDLTGMVMVRATPEEEGVIQAAIETLGGTPFGSYPTGGGGGGSGGLGLATPGHR